MIVFVVGCGGIGCEIFKCLTGKKVHEISVIDLDTIDITNINRQFIFKKEDIGRPKAEVAAEYLRQHLPKTKVISYYESILQPQRFSPLFFKNFDVVINALDNFTARSYVARMCYLVRVPLIDAGTTGLAGSVTFYKNDNHDSECYNCYNRDQKRVVPICTLKSGPNSDKDCVAYAVELMMRAFNLNPQSELVEYPVLDLDNLDESLHKFLVYTYSDEMKTRPKARNNISPELLRRHSQDAQEPPSKISGADDTWLEMTLSNISVAISTLYSATEEFASLITSGTTFTTFDASCKPMVLLVTCLATLHMHCFGLPGTLTPLKVGSIAGSIVPAITFSNAAVAALAVKLALSCHKHIDRPCFFFHKSSGRNPLSDTLRPPNAKCVVCSLPILTLHLMDLTLDSAADALLEQGHRLETLAFERDVWQASGLSNEVSGWDDEEVLPKRIITLYNGAVCLASINTDSEPQPKKFHVIIIQK